jgi:hypothetical protein
LYWKFRQRGNPPKLREDPTVPSDGCVEAFDSGVGHESAGDKCPSGRKASLENIFYCIFIREALFPDGHLPTSDS